jgi:hypothetical protein
MKGNVFVVELGLCDGTAQKLGRKQINSDHLRQRTVRPRRAPFCNFIEDPGDGHATAGLAKFCYVEI